MLFPAPAPAPAPQILSTLRSWLKETSGAGPGRVRLPPSVWPQGREEFSRDETWPCAGVHGVCLSCLTSDFLKANRGARSPLLFPRGPRGLTQEWQTCHVGGQLWPGGVLSGTATRGCRLPQRRLSRAQMGRRALRAGPQRCADSLPF